MYNNPIANKFDESKFLQVLERHNTNQIIPFPELFSIFSWYHINKDEARRVLYDLEKKGVLKIVPFHGIRLLRQ